MILPNFQETEEIIYGQYLIRSIHNISTYTNLVFAPHWHKYCEIILVNSGQLNATAEETTFQLSAGQIIFFNECELHSGISNQKCDYNAIQFKWSDILGTSDQETKLIQQLNDGYLKFKTPIADPVLEKLFNNMVDLCKTDSLTRPFEERKALSEFLIYLFNNYLFENPIVANPSSKDKFTEEVTTYIHMNYLTTSPKEVSDYFSFNQSYFNRKFKKAMLITPSEYINLCKIEYSQNLLRNTDLTLSEIAVQSGFNSLSYFTVTFKKIVGMSPLSWKNQ